MKIKYNEVEKSIEIEDGLKSQYLILKVVVILNMINALIQILGKKMTDYGFTEFLWIGLGLTSLVILVMFIFKMSTAEKISIREISGLEEKILFGKKRFALELKNGRKRNLGNFKNQLELAEARKIFEEIRIDNASE